MMWPWLVPAVGWTLVTLSSTLLLVSWEPAQGVPSSAHPYQSAHSWWLGARTHVPRVPSGGHDHDFHTEVVNGVLVAKGGTEFQ